MQRSTENFVGLREYVGRHDAEAPLPVIDEPIATVAAQPRYAVREQDLEWLVHLHRHDAIAHAHVAPGFTRQRGRQRTIFFGESLDRNPPLLILHAEQYGISRPGVNRTFGRLNRAGVRRESDVHDVLELARLDTARIAGDSCRVPTGTAGPKYRHWLGPQAPLLAHSMKSI